MRQNFYEDHLDTTKFCAHLIPSTWDYHESKLPRWKGFNGIISLYPTYIYSNLFCIKFYFNTSMNYKTLTLPYSKLFRATFSPEYQRSYGSVLILDDRYHPLYYRTQTRYFANPRDILWVQVSCNHMGGRAVHRNRCRRRLNAALNEALKDVRHCLRGGTLRGVDDNKGNGIGLTGTLKLLGMKDLLEADWGFIKEETNLLVDRLKSLNRGGRRGMNFIEERKFQTSESPRTVRYPSTQNFRKTII